MTAEQIELEAERLWRKDYPNGGSIYRTYESTPEHDKKLYRKDVLDNMERR